MKTVNTGVRKISIFSEHIFHFWNSLFRNNFCSCTIILSSTISILHFQILKLTALSLHFRKSKTSKSEYHILCGVQINCFGALELK